jgi:PadR family transcriptional regulator, regulatory protein AphA
MSLRFALLDLLANEPMSGYDLTRTFSVSLANVWPAQHSQIYPELAKLVADGLIAQTSGGPRGRKEYEATPEGVDALRSWLRDTTPDYRVRSEAMLRVFCLWTLPVDEAVAQLARDRAEYVRHRDEMVAAIETVDWGVSPCRRAGRLTIEYGRRYYDDLIEWVDWATTLVEAGMLRPDGPLPPGDGRAFPTAGALDSPCGPAGSF